MSNLYQIVFGHCRPKTIGLVTHSITISFGAADAGDSSNNQMTECQKLKEIADQNSARHMLGHFTPTCEADGSFSATQCHGSTGFCWCATPDGTEVSGTRTRAQKKPDCTSLLGEWIYPYWRRTCFGFRFGAFSSMRITEYLSYRYG